MLKRLIFCLWILLPFFLFAQNSAVKMGYRNARRRSDIPKFKIILPLTMPKAQRRAF